MNVARVAMVAGALALGLPTTALAAEVRSGDTAVVAAGETVNDDVYAFGNNVVIDGTVNGDVIAAGSTITINGRVTGDVMAAGNTVTIAAPVTGSVRAAGNLLNIAGPIGGDAVVAGSTIGVNGAGTIGRDVMGGGAAITLSGPVGRHVKVNGGTLTVASSVGGGIEARVSELVLASGAAVQGPIAYVSNSDMTVAPDAQIAGSVDRTAPPTRTPDPWVFGGIDLLGWLRGLVGLTIFGALLALVFPRASVRTAETVERQWLASLGLGFALLAAVPIVALLVLLLGIAIGGWWMSLILLAVYAVLAVTGYLAACLWTGTAAARIGKWQAHLVWRLVAGIAILGLLTLVPFIGGLVAFFAMLVGIGALALTAWSAYRRESVIATAPASPAATMPFPVAA